MTLTVVCGPDHLTYWRAFTDSPEPAPDPRIRMLGFVADVRPLYAEANLVMVPTTVSAGTNVKVLEAMAMQRAVVSTDFRLRRSRPTMDTASGSAIRPEAFAAGVATLLADPSRRAQIAHAAFCTPSATSTGELSARNSAPCSANCFRPSPKGAVRQQPPQRPPALTLCFPARPYSLAVLRALRRLCVLSNLAFAFSMSQCLW